MTAFCQDLVYYRTRKERSLGAAIPGCLPVLYLKGIFTAPIPCILGLNDLSSLVSYPQALFGLARYLKLDCLRPSAQFSLGV